MTSHKHDETILEKLQELCDILSETKGTNAKVEIMKKYTTVLEPIYKRVWRPNATSGVTPKSIIGFETSDRNIDNYNSDGLDLYTIMDKMIDRKTLGDESLTGHAAKRAIWNFIERHPDHKELCIKLFSLKLKLRLGTKTLAKVIPGLDFEKFTCLLADTYKYDADDHSIFDKQMESHLNLATHAYYSDKKDGVRLLAHHIPGKEEWEFMSRVGNKFVTLDELGEQLNHIMEDSKEFDIDSDIWLDGEFICFHPETGEEELSTTVSRIKKLAAHQIEDAAMYYVFDLLTNDQFKKTKKDDKMIFEDRLEKLQEFIGEGDDMVTVLDHTPYTTFDDLKNAIEVARIRDIEGLMLRMNHQYENKRSKNLLKIKFFQTEEFKIIDTEILDDYPFMNDKGGTDYVRALKNVFISYEGNTVRVGSGFSKKERIKFGKEDIIGKVITVRYQRESKSKTTENGKSLLLPTYHGFWGKKRDM